MKKADNFDAKQWLVENKITFQSRLNEDEEKRGFYVTMKPKDGSYGKSTLTNLPNHANQTYSGALRSIERLKDINGRKGKKYIYYISDIDGNPVDKNGNIINESRLNENFEETHEYLEISPENFQPGDYFLRTPVYDNSGEFFDHKEKIKILSIDLPKDGRSDISKVKTEDGEIMGLSSTSLYDIARPL